MIIRPLAAIRGAGRGMDDLLKAFLQEATAHVGAASTALPHFEKDQAGPAPIASLFSHIHSIEGARDVLDAPRRARAMPAHLARFLATVDRLSAPRVSAGAERKFESRARRVDETENLVLANGTDHIDRPAHIDLRLAKLMAALDTRRSRASRGQSAQERIGAKI
jgi:chemotaxis protein histidine kinase CheA